MYLSLKCSKPLILPVAVLKEEVVEDNGDTGSHHVRMEDVGRGEKTQISRR